jgi:3-methyl-2-oxobutanoate hydroxymethyltransferase
MDTEKARRIRAMKGAEKIAALAVYDFPMARLFDEAGIPFLLVGDSLGMVVLGYSDTTQVTLEDIIHHLRAVARAKPNALVAADLPIATYRTPEEAVASARRLVEAGAEAVKAEGGIEIVPQVKAIVAQGIPFCGHIGMLPQSVLQEGGYHLKGKVEEERLKLLADAEALEAAGAFALVLELVAPVVSAEITRRISIPTIGIASGTGCDGQILVSTDLTGTSPGRIPRHVKMRLNGSELIREIVTRWKSSVTQPPT